MAIVAVSHMFESTVYFIENATVIIFEAISSSRYKHLMTGELAAGLAYQQTTYCQDQPLCPSPPTQSVQKVGERCVYIV